MQSVARRLPTDQGGTQRREPARPTVKPFLTRRLRGVNNLGAIRQLYRQSRASQCNRTATGGGWATVICRKPVEARMAFVSEKLGQECRAGVRVAAQRGV